MNFCWTASKMRLKSMQFFGGNKLFLANYFQYSDTGDNVVLMCQKMKNFSVCETCTKVQLYKVHCSLEGMIFKVGFRVYL